MEENQQTEFQLSTSLLLTKGMVKLPKYQQKFTGKKVPLSIFNSVALYEAQLTLKSNRAASYLSTGQNLPEHHVPVEEIFRRYTKFQTV